MRLRPNEPVAGVPARRAPDLSVIFVTEFAWKELPIGWGSPRKTPLTSSGIFLSRALSNRVTAPRSKKADMNYQQGPRGRER